QLVEGQRPCPLHQRQRCRGAAGLSPVLAAGRHPSRPGNVPRCGRGDAASRQASEGRCGGDLFLGPRRQGLLRGGAAGRGGGRIGAAGGLALSRKRPTQRGVPSKIRTLLSSPPVASSPPSGLKVTASAGCGCRVRIKTSSPVGTSHRRVVLS